MIHIASTTAPVNIATLKYWGKRDTELNLPTNSSISVTLSQEDLRTLTSVATSENFLQDHLWLNGKEQLLNPRTQQCLQDLRTLRKKLEDSDKSLLPFSKWKLYIVSENNFPTAAGLASSAAGFAALVVSIAKLYQLPENATELSKIARKGSGSACRSLFGGYVAWEMGTHPDGSDSKAVQIADCDHWPNMKTIIFVVSSEKKDVSSTTGMQRTVATSDLFRERVNHVVPNRFKLMSEAIRNRDFTTFAELTIRDSNSFHATCLDSFPPIFYMNDISHRIIQLCHVINQFYKDTFVAYTCDAGANVVLYYLEENELYILAFLYKLFQTNPGWDSKFSPEKCNSFLSFHDEFIAPTLAAQLDTNLHNHISRVIVTGVGSGPQDTNISLIDESTGLPKTT